MKTQGLTIEDDEEEIFEDNEAEKDVVVDTFENTDQELDTTTNTTRKTAVIQNVRWARI